MISAAPQDGQHGERPRVRDSSDQRVEGSQSDEGDDEDADHATPQESLGRVEGALHPKKRPA